MLLYRIKEPMATATIQRSAAGLVLDGVFLPARQVDLVMESVKAGRSTSAEVASDTGLSVKTASACLSAMAKEGVLETVGTIGRPGRRPKVGLPNAVRELSETQITRVAETIERRTITETAVFSESEPESRPVPVPLKTSEPELVAAVMAAYEPEDEDLPDGEIDAHFEEITRLTELVKAERHATVGVEKFMADVLASAGDGDFLVSESALRGMVYEILTQKRLLELRTGELYDEMMKAKNEYRADDALRLLPEADQQKKKRKWPAVENVELKED